MLIQAVFYANPDAYPPIINSARLLAQAGYHVDILCREYGPVWAIDYPPGASVRRLHLPHRSSGAAYLAFVQQVLRQAHPKATIYVGHDMHGLLPARLLAARYRRPLVYHCHDFAEDHRFLTAGSRIVRFFERLWAKTADLVIAPDYERALVIQEQLRLDTIPIVVANSPICSPDHGHEHLTNALRDRGLSCKKIVFRQGSIGPFHAIEKTIESMPYWASNDWAFVIMGPSTFDYERSLTALANQVGVENRFAILPPVAYDEVADYTVGAHLGHGLYVPVNLNHQTATTASNKIMEYMAAGLPVLASDRPGLRALVERYDCGLTADESNPASIAAAVNTLLGDPQRAGQMGANAARAFEEEFRYDKQFAPVLAAITEMASPRRS